MKIVMCQKRCNRVCRVREKKTPENSLYDEYVLYDLYK